MLQQHLLNLLCINSIIPATRSIDDFNFAVKKTIAPSIILLFGDIILLPALLEQAQHVHKRLFVHLDLLNGIGKDEAGIKFLARLGVTGLITTKSHLCRLARDEGMIIIQRVFVTDSDAMRTGLHLLRNVKPDAVELLPASIPARVVEYFKKETDLPILGGGLIYTIEDVQQALNHGMAAISTSSRKLWLDLLNK
jgi:glycerol uptake operon antiterminator